MVFDVTVGTIRTSGRPGAGRTRDADAPEPRSHVRRDPLVGMLASHSAVRTLSLPSVGVLRTSDGDLPGGSRRGSPRLQRPGPGDADSRDGKVPSRPLYWLVSTVDIN